MEKTNITSIDPVERTVRRDPEEALSELRACTLESLDCVEKLARSYPGAVVVATTAFGIPSVVVITVSTDSDGMEIPHYFSPVTLDRARILAGIVACLPNEVLAAFESYLNYMKETAIRGAKIKSQPGGSE